MTSSQYNKGSLQEPKSKSEQTTRAEGRTALCGLGWVGLDWADMVTKDLEF